MGKVVALGNSSGNVGTLDQLGNKSAAEGITGAVAVDNILLLNGDDGVLLDGAVRLDNNGVVNSLGEDDETLALGVDLGELGNVGGNGLDVLGVGQVVGSGVGLGLTLVTKDNIHVGQDIIQNLGEELGDEGSREVHGEDLVLGGSVLGDLENALGGDGQEETLDVVDLGVLDQVPSLLSLDVLNSQLLGSRQLGDQGAVVARDQGGAGAGGEIAGDVDVLGGEAVGSGGRNQLRAEVVVGGGTNVDDRLGGQAALGTAGSVLGGTASDVDNFLVLDDLLVPNVDQVRSK